MLIFLDDLLWGKVLIVVLIAVGLLFTISSRWVQFRYFGQMFSIFGQATQHEDGHLSSFQALVLSVAGRVGAGNIAGVAVAITLGGQRIPNYEYYQAEGIPIGSGDIESLAKQINQRTKIVGASWSAKNMP